MPKDPSIRSVLVIGSGPIVIGQACEFDYSGTQAIKVLRREGIRVSLVNSNPATIMTDPEYADRTYVEPPGHDLLELVLVVCDPAAAPAEGERGAYHRGQAGQLEDADGFCQGSRKSALWKV